MDHNVGDLERQAAAAFGARLRERAAEKGRSSTEVARAAGIKRGAMTGYWNGDRVPPATKLFSIADFLESDARWLASGERGGAAGLVDAAAADWVEVSEYDLGQVDDDGLGEPVAVAPIRRDWLYSIVRTSTGLWLTRLLSDYTPAGLTEGTLVVCRSTRPEELAEGHVCLWRIANTVVVGRYSIAPDEMVARGIIGGQGAAGAIAPFLDTALGLPSGDVIVPPSAVAAGRYHLVGRILGTMLRPI